MKNLLKLAICTAVIFPLVSSGQSIDVTNPDNSGFFHELVTGMNSDVSTLYVPTAYSDFEYTHTGLNSGDFDAPGVGLPYTFRFELMAVNPTEFTLSGNEYARVGYFGNESMDVNTLKVQDNLLKTTDLYTYDQFGGVAPTTTPQSSSLKIQSPETSASFKFWHNNPIAGLTDQTNTDRFKFFQAYDANGTMLNAWVIGIDDRENDLVDFDDGFFFLQVVPEPSHIAGLAVLGLGALLMIRRRIKSRK